MDPRAHRPGTPGAPGVPENALGPAPQRHRWTALGGPCEIQCHLPPGLSLAAVAGAAESETRRIEHQYSRYRADSLLSRINAAAGSGTRIAVDDETAALLDYAAAAHAQSDGRFDITSGVLRRVWDFKARRVPDARDVAALLPLIGWQQVEWQRPHIHLPRAGMEIDFGGFGKEYAADRVAASLEALGLRHALVDLAGDIRVLGPHPDGQPWQIGIQHPRRPGAIATLPLHRGAIASSGDYERGFEHHGRRYHHLLDPRTGWPVEGLTAVSVVADQCLIAGTACTIALLHGTEGLAWLSELGLPHLVITPELHLGGSLAD